MTTEAPVALLTGAARRIGAVTAKTLHAYGYRVIIHYRGSKEAAESLCDELNALRPDSAVALQADLSQLKDIRRLADMALKRWGRIDALINNASSFYPTPLGEASEDQWNDLMSSNLKAPFFLAQALADALKETEGAIITLADIQADRPLKNHPIYCAAKAGNVMLTKSLARELAPEVRVNGIAPGAILWPEQEAELDDSGKASILDRVPLNRPGDPRDIADTILFLLTRAPYITGQIIAVDGGRSVS
ncbi:pteridine reductase [Marinimicrobium sp. C6131]|uniref:pteridine reductase n=1 Tax=Marinimicrobium sp. C6131 TaxID=3022676 RepID=UPI00223E10CC|nr:pteridine reductase [Marinimicrobium sp. C6131]UZJ42885.1 pteridine reductase [Marinimicrobium sp. C6131]